MDSLFLKFIKALSIWAIIQVWPSLMCFKLPERLLDEDHWLYRTKNWERDGRIYEKFFKVRKWKHRIPDAGSFFKFGFPKKTLKSSSKKYLKIFIGNEQSRMDAPDGHSSRTNFLFFQPLVDRYNNDLQCSGGKSSLCDPSEVQPAPDNENIKEAGRYIP